MGREDQIIQERLRKLKELIARGINPYPNKYDKKQNCLECSKSKIGSKVKTAGRLNTGFSSKSKDSIFLTIFIVLSLPGFFTKSEAIMIKIGGMDMFKSREPQIIIP